MIKRLLSLVIIAVVVMGLVITKPGPAQFAQWYIQEAEISTPLDGLMENVIAGQTETKDLVVAQMFIYQEQTFVGVADHIFGKTQVKGLAGSAKEAMEHAVEDAKEFVEAQ